MHFEEKMTCGLFQPYLTQASLSQPMAEAKSLESRLDPDLCRHITGTQYILVKFQQYPLPIELKLSVIFFASDWFMRIYMQMESETQTRFS